MASLEARKSGLVLEFRAFDACGDARLLSAVLTLFRGFMLDETLPGRDSSQDPELVKRSSLEGFDETFIEEQGLAVLNAARIALREESGPLDYLEAMLRERDCYAARMKRRFSEKADVMACISDQYNF